MSSNRAGGWGFRRPVHHTPANVGNEHNQQQQCQEHNNSVINEKHQHWSHSRAPIYNHNRNTEHDQISTVLVKQYGIHKLFIVSVSYVSRKLYTYKQKLGQFRAEVRRAMKFCRQKPAEQDWNTDWGKGGNSEDTLLAISTFMEGHDDNSSWKLFVRLDTAQEWMDLLE